MITKSINILIDRMNASEDKVQDLRMFHDMEVFSQSM